MRAWFVVAVLGCGCGRLGFGLTSDPGSGSDGGPGDGSLVDAGPCLGTTHQLTDNFDDNTFDAALWGNSYEDTSTRHVEANGRLEIRIAASSTNDWAGYVTTSTYQLAGDRVFVEVPVVNVQRGNTIMLLWTSLAKTDGPSVEHERGRLVMRRRIADQIFDRVDIAYDATAHRWWQVRERAGTMYWETSPDGALWTIRHQEPTPSVTTAVVTLAGGANNADPDPDLVVFDNLNGGGAPPLCP